MASIDRVGINAGGAPRSTRIGHYWALDGADGCPANPGADIYTDLVYVDTSLARVVLGDAPTYSASRNRAVLRPTAWSANQVIATSNETIRGAWTAISAKSVNHLSKSQ